MMKYLRFSICLLFPIAISAQGVFTNPKQVLGTVNGITRPVANATVTVCAASAAGIPCSPALAGVLFKDAALTQPLSNPFTTDASGNYQFATGPGNYTVTETASGFSGYSYQLSATFTGAPNCVTLSNIKCVDGVNLTLASVLAAPAANTTYWITANATLPTSNQTINATGVTFQCWNGAVISRTTPTALIINGANFASYGCIYDGGSLATVGQAYVLQNNGSIFKWNTFQNYTGTGGSLGNGVLQLAGATHFNVSENKWKNIVDDGIFATGNTQHGTISLNDIDTTSAAANGIHDIAFHSTTGGTNVSDFTITGNVMLNSAGFCVEVGGFGGNPAVDFAITGNKCKLVGSNWNGGYSLGTSSNWSIAGNVFDANGTTSTFQIGCIEVVFVVTDGTVSGNTCNDGTSTEGIRLDRTSRIVVTGNEVNGFKTGANDFGIYLVVASATGPIMTDNKVANNIVVFPAGGAGAGIWLQCNNNSASTHCDNNQIENNHIVSDGTALSQAIKIENDFAASTTSNTQLSFNHIIGAVTGVNVTTNVSNTQILDAINTAATPLNDLGVSTTRAVMPVAKGTWVLDTATQTLTNKTLTAPTLSGITNGTGLQLFNTATTCTTAATINTPCTTGAITLPVAYADTNYRLSVMCLGPTQFPQVQTVTKSNTTFTITLNNLTAAAATCSSFDVSAVHS